MPAVAALPYVPLATVQPGPGAPRLHIKLTRPADLKLYEVTNEITVSNYRTGFSRGTTRAAGHRRISDRQQRPTKITRRRAPTIARR